MIYQLSLHKLFLTKHSYEDLFVGGGTLWEGCKVAEGRYRSVVNNPILLQPPPHGFSMVALKR